MRARILGSLCSGAMAIAAPSNAQSIDELQSIAASTAQQLKRLDEADAALVSVLANRADELGFDDLHVGAIRNLLQGWRSYTSLECGLVGQATGGKSIARSEYALLCEGRRYAARIPVVLNVTACLVDKLRKASDETSAFDCLPNLTPLWGGDDYEA